MPNFSLDYDILSDALDADVADVADVADLKISNASIAEALSSCQSVLNKMDTVSSSDEVREIEKSFSSGDFPEKVISFLDNEESLLGRKSNDSFFRPLNDWAISACTKEDCIHRQECKLNFTSFEICIWSIIHCRLNKPQELMEIIKEIALYMKKADKELEDRLENKSF